MCQAESFESNVPVLAPFRRTLAEVGFRAGTISAARHDGHIAWVELKATARRGQVRPRTGLSHGRGLTLEQMALRILDSLDRSLREWIFKYGDFQFQIEDAKVVKTIISVSVYPHEEDQLTPFLR